MPTYFESIKQMRVRYRSAFSRYSGAHATMRAMQDQLPVHVDSAMLHGINAQHGVLTRAELEYRTLRRDYIGRLLSGSAK